MERRAPSLSLVLSLSCSSERHTVTIAPFFAELPSSDEGEREKMSLISHQNYIPLFSLYAREERRKVSQLIIGSIITDISCTWKDNSIERRSAQITRLVLKIIYIACALAETKLSKMRFAHRRIVISYLIAVNITCKLQKLHVLVKTWDI